MHVGPRHDDRVQLFAGHQLAEGGQAGGMIATARWVVEGLKAHSAMASITLGSITSTPGRASISTCADCSSRGKVL